MRSPVNEKSLCRIAVAKDSFGKIVGIGQVMTYTDAPTVQINRSDGTSFHWRADMCEECDLTVEEANLICGIPAK